MSGTVIGLTFGIFFVNIFFPAANTITGDLYDKLYMGKFVRNAVVPQP